MISAHSRGSIRQLTDTRQGALILSGGVTPLPLLLLYGLCAALSFAPRLASGQPLPLRSVMGVRLEVIVPAGPTVEVNDSLGNGHDRSFQSSSGGAQTGLGANISGSGFTPMRISMRSCGSGVSQGRTSLQTPATLNHSCTLYAVSAPPSSTAGMMLTTISLR